MKGHREILLASVAAVIMLLTVVAFGASRLHANWPEPPASSAAAAEPGELKGNSGKTETLLDSPVTGNAIQGLSVEPTATLVPAETVAGSAVTSPEAISPTTLPSAVPSPAAASPEAPSTLAESQSGSANSTEPPTKTLDGEASVLATPVSTAAPSPTSVPRRSKDSASPSAPSLSASPLQPTSTLQMVNDLAAREFIIIPAEVEENVQRIAEQGRQQGRDYRAFSRLGASIVDTRFFLAKWDLGPYALGPYDYLQETISYFEGSFERIGAATRRGLSSTSVMDPAWADKRLCKANENMVDCELRLHNPAVMLIVLGTNDIGSGAGFESTMNELVQYVIDQGVIPVLATKADRFEGSDDRNNTIIREVADSYQIPLWDFDKLAATIPGRGLGGDSVHMTLYDQYDYTAPRAFRTGYGVYNLSALMMLDAIRQLIVPAADESPLDLIG